MKPASQKGKEIVSNVPPRFCVDCKSVIYEAESETCPVCGKSLSNVLTQSEVSLCSKDAHNRDIDGYNRSQNALCFIVIGTICLAIGIFFVFLALQKKFNKIVGVNFLSLQFFVACIGIGAGLTCIIIGGINLYKAIKKRKSAQRDILVLGNLKENPSK